ncbi:MAG: universal stress protein [Myxococcales bacterium]|nr:universal stress protein [Myxococcales bacterium]
MTATGTMSDGRVARRPSVVFATQRQADEREALHRALALSHALSADLELVQLMPEPVTARPPTSAVGSTTEAARCLAWMEGLASFACRNIPVSYGPLSLHLRVGDPRVALQHLVAELNTVLVVVGGHPRGPWSGPVVSDWVATTGVPMLVARPTLNARGLVVEPSNNDQRRPILRAIAGLQARLECPITLVLGPSNPEAREALAKAARGCGIEGARLVVSRHRAADTLLEEARERRADLIVVGTRRRGWLKRIFEDDTASAVVDSGQRSVLVVSTDDSVALVGPPRA